MAEELKLQESIKKTQNLLKKYIKKPPLTEKLLRKPPFRFLHDIISAIIKETGFLANLFTEEESNSANIKNKEDKLAYLTKLIDAVKVITGNELTVRPSKIISGQEPIKTNELLQAIGRALEKNVSSAEAIGHYKETLEKKEKSKNSKPQPSTEVKKEAKKSSTSSETPSTRERSKNKELKPSNKRESKSSTKDSKPRASSVEKKDSKPKTHQNTPGNESNDPKKKRKSSTTKKRSTEPEKVADLTISAPEKVTTAQAASSRAPSEPLEAVEDNSAKALQEEEPKEQEKPPENEVEPSEPPKPTPRPLEKEVIEVAAPKTGGLLRPPSVRPSSARPAAPKIKAKSDFMINSAALTQIGNVSLIVENFNAKEDDGEEMVVVQSSTIDDTPTLYGPDALDRQLTQEHGYLVAQILETQKELVSERNVELIPNKVEIEWEAGAEKDKHAVVKEIDKLRGTIQSLTRTTNPLGKLLDYLQENVEIMEKEQEDWKNQFNNIREQLIIERNATKESVKPLKESLKEVEATIESQMEKILQTKANIIKNNHMIHRLLSNK